MVELYLSRLALDPRRYKVQRALADCHILHQHVLAGFPTASTPHAREEFGVLYRLDFDPRTTAPTLVVQSIVPPDWTEWEGSGLLAAGATPQTKDIATAYAAIGPKTRLRFRLRANPTRRINSSRAGTTPLAGKRVELRDEIGQRDWLARKADQCGFDVIGANVRQGDALGGKQHGRQRRNNQIQSLTFAMVTFDGMLEVTAAESFRQALLQGIGSGKAYGFGLLSVAPARE